MEKSTFDPTLKYIKESQKSNLDLFKVSETDQPKAEIGAKILYSACSKVENGVRVIDQEISSLAEQINKAYEGERTNYQEIDTMIRQLARLLARKAGINNLELSQLEVEEMRKEIEKIKKSYNNPLQLAIGVGCGTISVLAGVVGIGACGASLSAIGTATKAAETITKVAKQVSQITSSAQAVTQGVQTAAGKPVEDHYQSKRTELQFLLEEERRRRQISDQENTQSRQDRKGMESADNQAEYQRHRGIVGMLTGQGG
ncbi:MAG: hypothetical protein H7A37_05135 [Chlamydiales bacterium]|nr:hypothetical protein [Chlamydiales bacterium]